MSAARERLRILVADDFRDSAESLALLLRLGGDEVHVARDGLEAVEAAEQLRPDVVLLDLRMPRLDGLGACRRIRAQDWGRRMLLIAQSGLGVATVEGAGAAGFDAHLVKPVDPAALEELFARHGAARALDRLALSSRAR